MLGVLMSAQQSILVKVLQLLRVKMGYFYRCARQWSMRSYLRLGVRLSLMKMLWKQSINTRYLVYLAMTSRQERGSYCDVRLMRKQLMGSRISAQSTSLSAYSSSNIQHPYISIIIWSWIMPATCSGYASNRINAPPSIYLPNSTCQLSQNFLICPIYSTIWDQLSTILSMLDDSQYMAGSRLTTGSSYPSILLQQSALVWVLIFLNICS